MKPFGLRKASARHATVCLIALLLAGCTNAPPGPSETVVKDVDFEWHPGEREPSIRVLDDPEGKATTLEIFGLSTHGGSAYPARDKGFKGAEYDETKRELRLRLDSPEAYVMQPETTARWLVTLADVPPGPLNVIAHVRMVHCEDTCIERNSTTLEEEVLVS